MRGTVGAMCIGALCVLLIAPPTLADKEKPLRIEVEVSKEEYCKGDMELYSIHLYMNVTITNVSEKRIIFPKGGPSVDGGEFVAEEEDGSGQPAASHEFDTHLLFARSEKVDVPFVELAPKQKHKTTAFTSIVASYDKSFGWDSVISPGRYSLRLKVDWWLDEWVLSEYEKDYGESDDLAVGTYVTEPIPITIPKHPQTTKCGRITDQS